VLFIHAIKRLEGKFVPLYVIRAYRGTEGVAPIILTLGNGQLYTTPLPIEQKSMWAPEPLRTFAGLLLRRDSKPRLVQPVALSLQYLH
jgi:hypothetical protein